MRKLILKDIQRNYHKYISKKDYSKKILIEGVQIVELKNITSEDGYFLELARLDANGNFLGFPDFKVEQLNFSLLKPGGIKAWHLHFNQEDICFAPPDSHVLAGLIDLREKSATKGKILRVTLGNHRSLLLIIPRGVAHGFANNGSGDATIIYFHNQKFDSTKPDEYRLPWDKFGKDFWSPIKD